MKKKPYAHGAVWGGGGKTGGGLEPGPRLRHRRPAGRMLHTGPFLRQPHPDRSDLDLQHHFLQLRLSYDVASVEQVALKRKATAPLMPEQSETRRTSPATPRGGGGGGGGEVSRRFIASPLDNIADLSRELSSRRWQQLSKEMGAINMGLVDENLSSAALILTRFHGELCQQVYIDSSVTNDTCHALLRSMLDEDYLSMVPIFCRLRKRCSDTARESRLQVRTFHPRGLIRLNVFGNAFKILLFYFFVNSLTPFILAARLNCSQITSNFGFSTVSKSQ